MAFFTPGNLITLAIVALLLLLFRQLDKSKRPLEKVRKYADKLKEDIAAYAAEKEEAVKNYGVSLNVEQQAARELMKRLQLTDQELADKAAAVAKIDERIGAYDATLEELIQMTARVEENLNRLKDESAFVEDTRLQTKGLREKLSSLEKDLDKLGQRFERENEAALEKTQEAVIASLRSTVQDLEAQAETIERKVEDHREIIDRVEAERAERLDRDQERIEETLAHSLEEAGKRADKLEDAALVKLRDQAQDRVEKLKPALEEKIKTYQESAKTRVGELQELIRRQRSEAKTAAAEAAATVKEQQRQWQAEEASLSAAALSRQETWKQRIDEGEAALRDLETLFTAQKDRMDTSLAGQRDYVETSLEHLRQQWTALSGELETNQSLLEQKWLQVSQDMDAASERQREHWAGIAGGLEITLETQRNTWDAAAATLDLALAEHRDRTETALETQQGAFTQALQSQAEDLEQALSGQRQAWDQTAAAFETTLAGHSAQVEQALSARWDQANTALAIQRGQMDAALKALAEEFESALSAQRDRSAAALETQKRDWETLSAENQSDLEAQRQTWADLAAKHRDAFQGQLDGWYTTTEELARRLLEESEQRLETYRAAQGEEFQRLAAAADDTTRLEEELRRLMTEAEARVRSGFTRFEEEAADFRAEAAAGFDAQVKSFRAVLEGLQDELAELKESAHGTVSKNLKDFEDQFFADLAQRKLDIDHRFTDWQEAVEQRLGVLGEESAARRGEMETALAEESRKNLAAQGEKLTADLERLRKETAGLEMGIREEMRTADETRLSFQERLNRDMEELRLSAESSIKVEIGRYTLSVQESIKQNQRDMEGRLKELTDFLETRNGEIRASQDRVRELAEENDGRIAQFRLDLGKAREEAAAQRQEIFARTQEEAKDLSAAVEDAERRIKDFTAQTRLFERTDELKTELERRIEDLRGDIDRLDQRKSEVAQMEGEFARIRRLGDDVGAKMTRFLLEQRRIEVMEADFNRLIQTSQAVEAKLAQVSDTDDTLEAVQVQIRRLEDALRETEEKYQRVERKNQTLEETNNGIARNFKALQDSEAALTRIRQGQEDLTLRVETLRDNLETLTAESGKAQVTSERLGLLDETLAAIEQRIKDMQKAREWLAALETRMEDMYRQAQDHVKLAGDIVNRDSGPSYDDKSAVTPAVRENVLKLARRGWTVKEISNSVKLSEGAVELILEFASRDQ
jgi:chromosome segregation ATPase